MDESTKRRLERIAWNHANSSRNHEENWSFLFRKEGATSHDFFPLPGLDDWDFDGDVDGLDLPWTPERDLGIERSQDGNFSEIDLERMFEEGRRRYATQPGRRHLQESYEMLMAGTKEMQEACERRICRPLISSNGTRSRRPNGS